MAQAALDALVDTSPREYFTRVGHQTRLQALHAQCAEAGLFTASATADDVSRLFALFTLSLENGFGTLVVDYLAEVRGGGSHGGIDVPTRHSFDDLPTMRCCETIWGSALTRKSPNILKQLPSKPTPPPPGVL